MYDVNNYCYSAFIVVVLNQSVVSSVKHQIFCDWVHMNNVITCLFDTTPEDL